MQLRPLLLAAACAALAACNQGGGSENASAPAPSAPAAAVPKDPEAIKAALAALPAPYNAADLENGRKKFGLCRSCHTIEPGAPNMTGPNLHGVFGRNAASVEGYNYSDVLKASNIVWGPEPLDQWLAKPQEFLPGNKMTFLGVKDPKDRTDLIAYLMVESGYTGQ
ncbi:c-type cytochrome [Phenylobacterium terrae]|uniref:C-type cytochrome n=1 Tax=Phenylobacterium terrae TaxID=2665495 RepID=A0ABW4N8D8_9CAUL